MKAYWDFGILVLHMKIDDYRRERNELDSLLKDDSFSSKDEELGVLNSMNNLLEEFFAFLKKVRTPSDSE